MLSIVIFVLLTAATMLAASQGGHARRINAEYGLLQARYAAEAGVHATVAASQAWPRHELTSTEPLVAYETQTEPANPGSGPYRITSKGWARVGGEVYEARVHADVSEGRVVTWDFD